MALRWGIVSVGLISNDFTVALATLPSSEHQIVAVAARDAERAKQFAKLHNIPRSYGSYEELAKDPDIDVVYVGVINTVHSDVCILMLDNGKHVLCEKPLCMNYNEAENLLNHAKTKNLLLMEAVWSRFLPSYQYLKQQIENDKLGEIKEVDITFGFDLSKVDRVVKKPLGGGAILDIGIYTIQLCQWIFKELPTNIKATGKLNDDGVDTYVEAELTYPNSGLARIKVSVLEQLENNASIKGTKGEIILNSFWCANSLIDVDKKVKTWEFPKPGKKLNFINSTGMRYEAEEMRKCIKNHQIESKIMSHQESLILAKIGDKIRQMIGVAI